MIVLSTAYMAPVAYYAVMMHGENVCIEAHENYQKQSYRNRCIVGSEQGSQCLSVNVVAGNSKQLITDVQISDHADWQHQHEEALATNYGNSPFYEYYIDELLEMLHKGHDGTLFSLNENMRRKLCELIGMEDRVSYTDDYVVTTATEETPVVLSAQGQEEPLIDLRTTLHPKRPLELAVPQFCPISYYQISGVGGRQPFMPNLSILDLLFNMGPESILVLRDSWRTT